MKLASLTVIYYPHFCFLTHERDTMKKAKRNEQKPKYSEKKQGDAKTTTTLITPLCNVTRTAQQRTYEY
jgi:hypothetical protein